MLRVKPRLTLSFCFVNPLSENFTKWSNTFKQFVGNLPANRLSVFDHFVGLALKGLRSQILLVVLIWAVQVWFCDPTIELTARVWAVLHLK